MDKNKHLFYMRKLLMEFYSDDLLASELLFKGGTSAMLFEGLPRFSTDLDFNLVHKSNQAEVYQHIQKIVLRNGKIADCADKRFGPIVVLDYGTGDRNLKIEVSNRVFDSHYQLRNLGSSLIPVMTKPDMLTHKLCAMQARKAPRDVFDVWFFLSQGWPLNEYIIKERTGKETTVFLSGCLNSVSSVNSASVMTEIGELLDDSMKHFVKNGGLVKECSALLENYIACPIIVHSEPCEHTRLLFENDKLLPVLMKQRIDPSVVSCSKLAEILSGKRVALRKKTGEVVFVQISGGRIKVGKGFGLE